MIPKESQSTYLISPSPPRGVRAGFKIKLAPELLEAAWAYHISYLGAGIEGSFNDTVQELVRMGLSATPMNASVLAVRLRAYNTSRRECLKVALRPFREMEQILIDRLAELDRRAPTSAEEATVLQELDSLRDFERTNGHPS